MPPSVAILVFACFSFWLFARDAKRSNNTSAALWLPVVWACIIASKPVSLWLGMAAAEGDAGYQDSLLDKGLFLFLIAASLNVLARRRTNWHRVIGANKWLFIFFVYLGISVVWSEDPFVALKRWIKDVGNIIMVLVILGERDVSQAIRTFFARCVNLLIPLSVLVVKYFPAISRNYDRWTYQPQNIGIATDKNTFGITLFICALSLCWIFLEFRNATEGRRDKVTGITYLVLILMTVWLLHKAQSSTALFCTVLGVCVLVSMKCSTIRAQVEWLGLYTVGAVFLALIAYMLGLWDMLIAIVAHTVNRDPTLHGRTDIWAALLQEDINPLLGAGYYSFWSVERNQRISAKYYYSLGEAHNAYLETYLNSGLIGLVLLIAMLFFAVKRFKQEVLTGSSYGALNMAFMVTAAFYAMSEAIFNRLSLLWFVILLVTLEYPRASSTSPAKSRQIGKTNDISVPAPWARSCWSPHAVPAGSLARVPRRKT